MEKCPLALKKVGGKGEDEELVEWENWARNQLMAAGSDLLGKFSNLQVTLLLNLILICFTTSTSTSTVLICGVYLLCISTMKTGDLNHERLHWRPARCQF